MFLKPLQPGSRFSGWSPCSTTMWPGRGWRFGGQLRIQTFFNEEVRWTKQSWHHTLNENCKDISCVCIYWNICVCVYGCPNCVVYIYSVCLSTCFIFMCSCICCVHYIRLQHASLLKRPPVSTHPATWPFLDGHGTTRNPSHIPQLFSPVYQPYATAPKWDRRDFNCGALWALGQNGHEKYEKTQKDLGVWVHKRWFDVIWCDLHLLFQALAGKKNWRLQNWGEENCLTRVLMYYWVYILCAAT